MSAGERGWRRLTGRFGADTAPPGMVPADKLAAQARREAVAAGTGGAGSGGGWDGAGGGGAAGGRGAARAELLGERERLTERFALLQADLGGAFYEMAIRNHVRMEVLTRKAAELQRVDQALESVERELRHLETAP